MQRKIDDEMRLATVSQAAPTEAPNLARAVGSRKAWRSRSAAAGVIALALGLAGCGGSDNDDPPVETPAPPAETPAPPAETPAPPAPTPQPADPTPAGFTKAGEIQSAAAADVGDSFASTADPTRVVVFNPAKSKYYELVTPAAPITFADAVAAAATKGALLASPSDAEQLTFVKQAFGTQLPVGGAASGANGAWVGLQQTGGATPTEGWTFLDTVALTNAAFWNPGEPNDGGSGAENGVENIGAMFAGQTVAETDLAMFYDAGAVGSTDKQTMYLIEWSSKEAVK